MPNASDKTNSLPTKIVLCAGLKSSGSTWLYNAAIQLCALRVRSERGSRTRLMPFYAETIEQFPDGSERAGLLVVKTHIPSTNLVFLTRFARGTIFVTVREPRDSVASLMQRFGHPFEACLQEVAAGSARIVELTRVTRPLILRYEDRFFERPQTISRMAKRLGVVISKPVAERIFQALSVEKIQKRITALAARGVFGDRPDPNRFDPRTHWHPGHLGDGKSGKYTEILSPGMQRAVLHAMREYCLEFGYETTARTGPRARKTIVRDHRGSGVRKRNGLS